MTSNNDSRNNKKVLSESKTALKFMQAIASGKNSEAETAFESMISGKLEQRIKDVVSKEMRTSASK